MDPVATDKWFEAISSMFELAEQSAGPGKTRGWPALCSKASAPMALMAREAEAYASDLGEPSPGSAEPTVSPSIRRMAAELGMELQRVRISGRGGRVKFGDLRAYSQRLQTLAAAPKSQVGAAGSAKPVLEQIDFSKWGPALKKPMTPLRKTLARRMVENWNAIPNFAEADAIL